MSLTANVIVALIIDIIVACALSAAIYAVLSLLLWAWLAAVIAIIGMACISTQDVVVTAKAHAYETAVNGCAAVVGWFAAKVQA